MTRPTATETQVIIRLDNEDSTILPSYVHVHSAKNHERCQRIEATPYIHLATTFECEDHARRFAASRFLTRVTFLPWKPDAR